MSGDFNSAGLYHLLLRELGSPGAPDFTGGGVKSHFTPCDFRQTDAVLMAGGDLCWFLPEEEKLSLQERQVPIIALSPYANRTTAQAQVVLPVALAGVESEEIAYRMDGLPVTLRALVSAAAPPDHQVLADLDLFT
jgi:formylmethanofuran dehydrogenase subunit B